MGPNYSISTACATANYAFVSASNHIRNGDADVMIVSGASHSTCSVFFPHAHDRPAVGQTLLLLEAEAHTAIWVENLQLACRLLPAGVGAAQHEAIGLTGRCPSLQTVVLMGGRLA